MQLLLYFGFTALQCHIIKLLYAGGGFIPLIHTLGQPLPRSKIYLAILGCTHATNNDDDAKYESFINIVRLASAARYFTVPVYRSHRRCQLMPNSHRPPDTTRQCCLCRVRRCELSLETVWQSLHSQPIDHPSRVAFSGEVQAYV